MLVPTYARRTASSFWTFLALAAFVDSSELNCLRRSLTVDATNVSTFAISCSRLEKKSSDAFASPDMFSMMRLSLA